MVFFASSKYDFNPGTNNNLLPASGFLVHGVLALFFLVSLAIVFHLNRRAVRGKSLYGYPRALNPVRLARMGLISSVLPVVFGLARFYGAGQPHGASTRAYFIQAPLGITPWPFVFAYFVLAAHVMAVGMARWFAMRALRAQLKHCDLGAISTVILFSPRRSDFPRATLDALDQSSTGNHQLVVLCPPTIGWDATAEPYNSFLPFPHVFYDDVYASFPTESGVAACVVLSPSAQAVFGAVSDHLFRECSRVLAPGGTLIIAAPVAGRKEIAAALARHGFDASSIATSLFATLPFPVTWMRVTKNGGESHTPLETSLLSAESAELDRDTPLRNVEVDAQVCSINSKHQTEEKIATSIGARIAVCLTTMLAIAAIIELASFALWTKLDVPSHIVYSDRINASLLGTYAPLYTFACIEVIVGQFALLRSQHETPPRILRLILPFITAGPAILVFNAITAVPTLLVDAFILKGKDPSTMKTASSITGAVFLVVLLSLAVKSSRRKLVDTSASSMKSRFGELR